MPVFNTSTVEKKKKHRFDDCSVSNFPMTGLALSFHRTDRYT